VTGSLSFVMPRKLVVHRDGALLAFDVLLKDVLSQRDLWGLRSRSCELHPFRRGQGRVPPSWMIRVVRRTEWFSSSVAWRVSSAMTASLLGPRTTLEPIQYWYRPATRPRRPCTAGPAFLHIHPTMVVPFVPIRGSPQFRSYLSLTGSDNGSPVLSCPAHSVGDSPDDRSGGDRPGDHERDEHPGD